MGTIKIGILDDDLSYVEKLSAYMNRLDNDIWSVAGFTDDGVLEKYMRERGLNLLMGTSKEILMNYKEEFPDACCVWLTDEKEYGGVSRKTSAGIERVYRYQSANSVGQAIMAIVKSLDMVRMTNKKFAVVYSPVGRCGKTTLAMKYVEEMKHGSWLYVGMEDYSFLVDEDKYAAEDFLFFVKERRESAVCEMLDNVSGIIPSPFSPFDTRQIGVDDVDWILDVFNRSLKFDGALFDMGTGILQNLNVLLKFDLVIVPYVSEEKSLEKKQQFEELIKAYKLEELFEKIHYIDMGKGNPLYEMQVILG